MKKKMISGEWLVVGMRDEEEDGWWGVVGGGVIDPLLSRAPADCGKGVLTMNMIIIISKVMVGVITRL